MSDYWRGFAHAYGVGFLTTSAMVVGFVMGVVAEQNYPEDGEDDG